MLPDIFGMKDGKYQQFWSTNNIKQNSSVVVGRVGFIISNPWFNYITCITAMSTIQLLQVPKYSRIYQSKYVVCFRPKNMIDENEMVNQGKKVNMAVRRARQVQRHQRDHGWQRRQEHQSTLGGESGPGQGCLH
jgi:hypothetical protein